MEAVVEIDENERYWVGGGFGCRGLLPNDRAPFSSSDGSMSWKSLEQASEDLVLLGRGWRYEEGTRFESIGQWMYAADFRAESIKNAKPDRGMASFVRFRRLYRTKIFNPDEFIPRRISEKCNQVDSIATHALADLLLDVLTYCTLLQSPAHHTQAVTLPLKERVINVAIGLNYPPANAAPDVMDAAFQLELLKKKLETFVEEERAKTIMNRLLTSVEFTFDQRQGRKAFGDRKALTGSCFPKQEREAIATLIIKKLDTQFQLHCEVPECGQNCRFYRVPCPNEGCNFIVSKMYLAKHDQECPFAIIHCECGDEFPRLQSTVHAEQACKFRTVECPFKNLGCLHEVRAIDLKAHVVDDAPGHLLLAVNRMAEHQDVIRKLHAKVDTLEKDNQLLHENAEKIEKEFKDQISKLQAQVTKMTKEFATLEKTCKKEFSQQHTLRDS
ncbi:TRAF-type zinc finger domain containing protein [Nitzschia inconspicua]|uniref:TRAF-type zinc finger domain containing protein n=1 Tax=Nitzschia inconspicua TaxID=303405 RepID=A0A9K3PYS5_9STRA|nr:TRAF-type zinc finger domain containing protein [Nitzschia inconspicua]